MKLKNLIVASLGVLVISCATDKDTDRKLYSFEKYGIKLSTRNSCFIYLNSDVKSDTLHILAFEKDSIVLRKLIHMNEEKKKKFMDLVIKHIDVNALSKSDPSTMDGDYVSFYIENNSKRISFECKNLFNFKQISGDLDDYIINLRKESNDIDKLFK